MIPTEIVTGAGRVSLGAVLPQGALPAEPAADGESKAEKNVKKK